MKNNYEIVFAAVSNYGHALQYASKELRNNYDIVFAAVSNNGNALQYTPEELKNDFDIVFAAVNNNGSALDFAPEELKNNYQQSFSWILRPSRTGCVPIRGPKDARLGHARARAPAGTGRWRR